MKLGKTIVWCWQLLDVMLKHSWLQSNIEWGDWTLSSTSLLSTFPFARSSLLRLLSDLHPATVVMDFFTNPHGSWVTLGLKQKRYDYYRSWKKLPDHWISVDVIKSVPGWIIVFLKCIAYCRVVVDKIYVFYKFIIIIKICYRQTN